MTRYLIEVPHENRKDACNRAVEVFLETGSHFMTNADWGCNDDVHKAWVIVDVGSKEEARSIVPPLFRNDALVVELQKFSIEDLDHIKGLHAD
jgi:hypothetical protein